MLNERGRLHVGDYEKNSSKNEHCVYDPCCLNLLISSEF